MKALRRLLAGVVMLHTLAAEQAWAVDNEVGSWLIGAVTGELGVGDP